MDVTFQNVQLYCTKNSLFTITYPTFKTTLVTKLYSLLFTMDCCLKHETECKQPRQTGCLTIKTVLKAWLFSLYIFFFI